MGYMGPVFPAKAGIHITVAYGNLLVARLYGFPPARERRENEKALIQPGHLLVIPVRTSDNDVLGDAERAGEASSGPVRCIRNSA